MLRVSNVTGRGAVTFSKMNDYYKPCCGMTHYYEADGIAIDGKADVRGQADA